MNRPARAPNLLSLGLLLLGGAPDPQSVAAQPADRPAVIHQLRMYEIFEHNKQAFHDRFRDHALRIMARHDFKVLAIWEAKTDERTQFIYLLEWPDERTMQDRWARFLADREWIDIKKQSAAIHGAVVGEIEQRTLRPVDYSPARAIFPKT